MTGQPPGAAGGASEQVVAFECAGDSLFGVLHGGADDATRGVLVVVGGPQTRVGSHRQFVLLPRRVAAAGDAATGCLRQPRYESRTHV